VRYLLCGGPAFGRLKPDYRHEYQRQQQRKKRQEADEAVIDQRCPLAWRTRGA
jgi:hypothetical protein